MSDDAVWKVLADPARRALLDILHAAPRTTGELARVFPTSRYAVMKHLLVLVGANLVIVRRRGRERWNYINAMPLRRLYERWGSMESAGATAGDEVRSARVEEVGIDGVELKSPSDRKAGRKTVASLKDGWNLLFAEGLKAYIEGDKAEVTHSGS